MRSKTNNFKRKQASLHWDHFGPMEKSVIAVVPLLLTFVSFQSSSIIRACYRQDTAAPALCPHAGLFAALQSLSYDLWLLSNATWGSCQLIFKFFLNKEKKQKEKTVPCSQPQFQPVTNRVEALAEATFKLDSWSRPLSSHHHHYLPRETASEDGLVWNSTWVQRFTSHAKFCFEQHWWTSRVISMKMCYTQIQQAGAWQFTRMCS